MATNIVEVHEQLYAHLTENHPNTTFSLRSNNTDHKLEQGYWFEGDGVHLYLTFWASSIFKKVPIYVEIRLNSMRVTLCVDATDTNNEFQKWSGSFTQLMFYPPGANHYLIKTISYQNSFLEAIDTIIQENIHGIDSIVPKKPKYKEEFFYSIDAEEFAKNKALIEKYRNISPTKNEYILKNYEYTPIVLRDLRIENIRHISTTTLLFHKNLTCFIGLNGTGKSTILQSIILGIIGVNANKDFVKIKINYDKIAEMLRMTEQNRLPIFSENGSIEVRYATKNGDKTYKTNFQGRESKALVLENIKNEDTINYGNGHLHFLVLGFPQQKGENIEDDKDVKNTLPNIYDFKNLLNAEADNRFQKVERWFFSLYNEALNQADKQKIVKEKTKEYEILNIASEILSKITGEKIYLHDTKYYGKEELTWLSINSKIELMRVVSQGYENVLTWVGYLLQRLYDIHKNTPFETIFDIPALVLIDEIDTYLHPQWQSTIIAVLVEKFPKVQFVITTHSPYIVGSVPSDKIKIYTCNKNEEGEVDVTEFKGFTAYGADMKELSARLYGNIERPVQAIQATFVTLFSDLERFENTPNDSDLQQKITATIVDLESKIHAADPELLSVKSQLDMILILNEMEKEGA
ncbi:MAG: hypothetical protein RLZZ292_2872 [Bacteroidota bacterium]|jgi:predicted ATP-binding protein involved in virulence